MREVKTIVYKYDELSETAKEAAYQEWASNEDYPWSSDNEKTLEAFESIFPIKHKDYEYGYRNFINYKMDYLDREDVKDFTGVRLYKWILNNFYPYLYKPKFIGIVRKHTKHKRTRNITAKQTKNEYSMYYSAIFETNCCVLTGYCIDDDILKPIYDYIVKPDKYTTIEDLLYNCLQSWVFACKNDYENHFSEANFNDICEANEYDFTEDGKLF